MLLDHKETRSPVGPNAHGATPDWIAALQSPLYTAVEQRVLRQLIEALLFEDLLPYEEQKQPPGPEGVVLFGKARNGETVQYLAEGAFKRSFGLLRLKHKPVVRLVAGQPATTATLTDFGTEVLAQRTQASRLVGFMNELEQTLLKDVQAQATRQPSRLTDAQRQYDALESHLMDAHSYHPCYKSRLGFSLADNRAYGPEFQQPVSMHWVALHRNKARVNSSDRVEYEAYMRYILGEATLDRFEHQLKSRDRRLADYWLLPVHPWQWDERVTTRFHPELANGDLVWLGPDEDQYRPQQSLRTLANASDPTKPYAKVSLGITNTSTSRIMAAHTCLNGPVITDWLQGLIERDPIARDMEFAILGEVLGVTCDYETLEVGRRLPVYGHLGVVWRESLHRYLRDGEEAIPFNGLGHLQGNGEPLIDTWVTQYGIEEWTRQVLRVSVGPIIHMLFGHGIGMESHGQNIVLIHENGWPKRTALKDFHDGVRYCPSLLAYPEQSPELYPVPPTHARINPNSYILTEDCDEIRDYTCDAFFFIALSDLCLFLNDRYSLAESRFWRMTAQVIHDYQAAHPEHRARYERFDVFSEHFAVEELTKRRLLGDGEARIKRVSNPLAAFKQGAA